jgi:anti-sigma regulatory factor (Ser/Thr protein kinase)
MRDLSLHVLDLIENSIRAEATVIAVTVVEDPEKDILKIIVEDNGSGLGVPPEVATDPFYTTKDGKKTGLGLSLIRGAAERAGGGVELRQSKLGGLAVTATMQLSHIDRTPMGDLATTISSVVCTNPGIDLGCRFVVGKREWAVWSSEVAKELPASERGGLAVARRVSEHIKAGLAAIEVVA